MTITTIRLSLSKATTKSRDWFNAAPPEVQEQYIKDHPRSKYAKQQREDDEDDGAEEKRKVSGQASIGTTMVGDKRMQADGSELPDHIKSLVIPPAWTDVKFNPDPNGALLAVGKDSKGRRQSVYSAEFTKTQAEAKFRRIEELNAKFSEIEQQNAKGRRSKDPKVKDVADCLHLIMKTGIRPGSDDDTGADVKAYGATTLTADHVVKTKEGVFLKFVGKKGVKLNIPIDDPELASSLVKRAKTAGAGGKLFPTTNDKNLLAYTHTMDGGGFKTKDFRTHLGTSHAMSEVKRINETAPPGTAKDYRKMVLDVAKSVATKLGNTPVVALQSYISPTVFSDWRNGLPAEESAALDAPKKQTKPEVK